MKAKVKKRKQLDHSKYILRLGNNIFFHDWLLQKINSICQFIIKACLPIGYYRTHQHHKLCQQHPKAQFSCANLPLN